MARLQETFLGVAGKFGVALAGFFAILAVGRMADWMGGMGSFEASVMFLGVCLVITIVWAVGALSGALMALCREIRVAVENLEAFWSEEDLEQHEEWEDWAESEPERQLLGDRFGGCLCPCGSGKPYRLCCGRKN